MKNRLIGIITLILLSSVSHAKESEFLFSSALVGMSMDYREYDGKGEILDSEKSSLSEMMGLEFRLAYRQVQESKNFTEIGINLIILGGETQYIGGVYNSVTKIFGPYGSYIGKSYNVIYDTCLDYKFTHVNNNLDINYGLGLGYRSWRRELSANQIEVYSWYSLRPHVGLVYNIDKFSIGIETEYQYGINPEMPILANSENPETTFILGSANILQLSMPLTYSLNTQLDLFAVYTFQHQIIEASEPKNYILDGNTESVYEPDSKANNQYLKFGATFKF